MTRLDDFQQEVLDAFFAREEGFYLTGGAALVGFHLHHRETLDLDLFTLADRGVRVDPPEEILANKLCTLLSRAELKDLVDVWALEKAGYSLEKSLAAASAKDGGLTPGQLAWVLSQLQIGSEAKPPGGVTGAELRAYQRDLAERLTVLSHPGQ